MEILVPLFAFLAGALVAAGMVYAFFKDREAHFQEQSRESGERVAKEAVRRSGATIKGQIGERFAPFVPGFGYEPADARFLGSPVDYVVFDGLAAGEIQRVAFVEVKTGAATLTPFQRQVRAAIRAGDVIWRVVELPDPTGA